MNRSGSLSSCGRLKKSIVGDGHIGRTDHWHFDTIGGTGAAEKIIDIIVIDNDIIIGAHHTTSS